MIDQSKVEVIIAAADKPPIAGVSVMAAYINALKSQERRDLAGLAYFGNGEYLTYRIAYAAALEVMGHSDTVKDDLLTRLGPQGPARNLRTGLALLREDRE